MVRWLVLLDSLVVDATVR